MEVSNEIYKYENNILIIIHYYGTHMDTGILHQRYKIVVNTDEYQLSHLMDENMKENIAMYIKRYKKQTEYEFREMEYNEKMEEIFNEVCLDYIETKYNLSRAERYMFAQYCYKMNEFNIDYYITQNPCSHIDLKSKFDYNLYSLYKKEAEAYIMVKQNNLIKNCIK